MMATPDFTTRLALALDRAEAAGSFGPGSPPAPELVREADQARTLPAAMAVVYARANGLLLQSAEIFDPLDYVDVNGDADLFAEMPNVTFMGGDGMDGFLLFDEQRTLGGDAETIYWSDRSELSPDEARVAAGDLAELLELALAGEALNEGPTVGTRSLEALIETVARHPEDVLAHPGYGDPEAMLAARDLPVSIPFGLIDFYAQYDGLILRPMGVEVFSMSRVKPVDPATQDGRVGAVWIGNDKSGWRLALTCGGWRGLPANRLIMVRNEADVESAATLGRFTDVLRAWIDGEGRPA